MVVIGLKIGEGLKLVDVDVVGLKILDHWFEFNFGSLGFKSQIIVGICFLGYMFSNRGSLWVYVFLGFKSRILADFWVYVFLLIFGYVFSFLCLVDERSSAGFVFVFLLETGLCFCVWLTREIHCWVCVCVIVGDRFVFCVLGSMFLCLCSWLLCFVLWVCVLGSVFLLFLFLLFLDLGFFLKSFWACDFLFLIFFI